MSNLTKTSVLKASTSYRPFAYPWAFDAYKEMQRLHWLPEEVPLQEDCRDWDEKLTPAEQNLLTQLFRFFTQADADIGCGYGSIYLPTFKPVEIQMMLSSFMTSEANHMDSYSQLIDTIGLPEAEYKAFAAFKEMKEKHEYLFASRTKNSDGTKRSKIERLALDLAVFSAFGEGMQLFSSFAILLSFKRRNLMKGMSTIVEWSLRDESHHVECMIKLFHTLIRENPKAWTPALWEAIAETCREMVILEDKFIDLMFAMGPVDGVTPEETKLYIRYIADRRMIQLGLKPIYGQKDNPYRWIDGMMSAHTHTNFFEGRSTEYSKGGVTGWDKNPFGFADRIKHLISTFVKKPSRTNRLVLYTKTGCPYCSLIKAELTKRGYAFDIVDLSDDGDRKKFYEATGTNSVPQLFEHDGNVISLTPSGKRYGGYSDLSSDWSVLSGPTLH